MAERDMAAGLSNAELFDRLRALGVDVGPVNDTTRQVYLNKYKAVIAIGPTPPRKHQPRSSPASRKQHFPTRTPPSLQQEQEVAGPATPPTTPPELAADHPEGVVVDYLLQSFDNSSQSGSDTAFLFPTGEVIVASRGVLASQCAPLIPVLYNSQVPYPVKVSTLTGQTSDFLIRSDELVMDLKEKICMVHGIQVEEQRLVFKQQELQNEGRFGEYGVIAGSTLHLVLSAGDQDSSVASTTTFRCPNMSPTLSIHHFRVGFSMEQLSCCAPLQTAPLQPQPPQVSLPAHLAHIVHVYDVPYSAVWTFLRYLHCRTLKYEGSCQCEAFLMCFVLAEWFQLPSLAQSCLSLLPAHLTVESAKQVLHFSKAINSPPLEQMCRAYLNSAS